MCWNFFICSYNDLSMILYNDIYLIMYLDIFFLHPLIELSVPMLRCTFYVVAILRKSIL